MSRLDLNFLGTFEVKIEGKRVSNFRSLNVQGLLVYLVLQGERPIPRDSLAVLFWPEEPERTARKNLRQTIYQLRQILGDDGGGERPARYPRSWKATIRGKPKKHRRQSHKQKAGAPARAPA